MPTDFNESVIAKFRAHGGTVGGDLAGTPIILVHHYGARTRTERATPVRPSRRNGTRHNPATLAA